MGARISRTAHVHARPLLLSEVSKTARDRVYQQMKRDKTQSPTESGREQNRQNQ